jgi:hypothetical protein
MEAESRSWPLTPWRRFTGVAAALWWAAYAALHITSYREHMWWLTRLSWIIIIALTLVLSGAFLWRTRRPALALEGEWLLLPKLFGTTRLVRADVVGLRVQPGDLPQVLQTVSLQVRDADPVSIKGLVDLQDSLDFNNSVAQIAEAVGVGVTGESGQFAHQSSYSPESGYRVPSLSNLQRTVLGLYALLWGGASVFVLYSMTNSRWSINPAALIACGALWAVVLLLWIVAESTLKNKRARAQQSVS